MLFRHAFGVAASVVAMLAALYVASEVSWGLSALLDQRGGMHIYALRAGGSQTHLGDSQIIVDPLSPVLVVTLAVVAIVGIVGDLGRNKLPWLKWYLPLLPAVPLGVWFGLLTSGDALPAELPTYVPLVVGTTLGLVIAMLVGAYWGAMLLAERVMSRRVKSE